MSCCGITRSPRRDRFRGAIDASLRHLGPQQPGPEPGLDLGVALVRVFALQRLPAHGNGELVELERGAHAFLQRAHEKTLPVRLSGSADSSAAMLVHSPLLASLASSPSRKARALSRAARRTGEVVASSSWRTRARESSRLLRRWRRWSSAAPG